MTIPIPHTAAGLHGAGTDVKLSPSAAAHVRSHTNGQSGRQEFFIQFGSDATKTAMVRIGDNGTVARKVAAALNGFDSPVAIETAVRRLHRCGLSTAATHLLLSELLAYDIVLSHHPAPSVALMGNNRLALQIRQLLSAHGISVRIPLKNESAPAFLAGTSASRSIVSTAPMPVHRQAELARAVRNFGGVFIPVRVADGRGVVGPISINHFGPCPVCVDMHHAAADPHCSLASRQAFTPPDPDVLTMEEGFVASFVAALLARHYGAAGPPPGMRHHQPQRLPQLQAGAMFELSPFLVDINTTVVQAHPGCPVCW